MSIFLITKMVPGVLLVIPYFILMQQVGQFNLYTSLIIAYTSFTLYIVIWILWGINGSGPNGLDEAVLNDGRTGISVFFNIIQQLSTSALISTMTFTFLVSSTVLLTTKEMFLVTTGITSFIGQYKISWGELMEVGVASIITIIMFFAFQDKYLIEGLTRGAIM